MNMTSKQREFLTIIMNNKEVLEELFKRRSFTETGKGFTDEGKYFYCWY